MGTIANQFRKGWFRDPEDWHGTYRMTGALELLKAGGIEPVWTHGNTPINEWVDFGKVRHGCADNCTVTWAAWVTDTMFETAYILADLIQTRQGDYHKARLDARQHSHQ